MRDTISHSHLIDSVGIVGLGYVGLPLAAAFAEAGLSVVGVDTSRNNIAALFSGESYIEGVPAERLQPLIAAQRLRPTGSYHDLREVQATIICLPTPLDEHREPDLSVAVAGAQTLAHKPQPRGLVVLEST